MNKKEILSLIATLEKTPDQMTKQHLKKVYAILIACGHYPICPWCNKPIYNINDFSWDHITPRSLGGKNTLDNLQPMHKHCNNEDKQAIAYQTEYNYDLKSDLEETVYNVRITVSKKRAQT
ncbi:MAG: HNH endonuclease, partial [Alphaproteobacteria bacterium]|nr:HNH endonuclease [Alphaproteobacteria bacterium]